MRLGFFHDTPYPNWKPHKDWHIPYSVPPSPLPTPKILPLFTLNFMIHYQQNPLYSQIFLEHSLHLFAFKVVAVCIYSHDCHIIGPGHQVGVLLSSDHSQSFPPDNPKLRISCFQTSPTLCNSFGHLLIFFSSQYTHLMYLLFYFISLLFYFQRH